MTFLRLKISQFIGIMGQYTLWTTGEICWGHQVWSWGAAVYPGWAQWSGLWSLYEPCSWGNLCVSDCNQDIAVFLVGIRTRQTFRARLGTGRCNGDVTDAVTQIWTLNGAFLEAWFADTIYLVYVLVRALEMISCHFLIIEVVERVLIIEVVERNWVPFELYALTLAPPDARCTAFSWRSSTFWPVIPRWLRSRS